MKIVWSPIAVDRAHEEAAYIARDKPGAALRWLEGLFDSTDRLKTFPRSGQMVPEIGLEEYREIRYGSHRVIYRLDANVVAILTVRRRKQMLNPAELSPSE